MEVLYTRSIALFTPVSGAPDRRQLFATPGTNRIAMFREHKRIDARFPAMPPSIAPDLGSWSKKKPTIVSNWGEIWGASL